MPGGYIQLAAFGSQDFYLTANPQISFFKTVYRRYTNFTMGFFRINPEGNLGLNDQEVVTYKFKIERNADLINQIEEIKAKSHHLLHPGPFLLH